MSDKTAAKKTPNFGKLLSYSVVAVAAFGWIPGYAFASLTTWQTVFVLIAKICAFGGMVMFAWSLILSGRFKIFDQMFGGLDKVYKTHRRFGSLGMILILLHPLALIFLRLPSAGVSSFSVLWNFTNVSIMFGLVAFYASILLIAWSLWVKSSHETFVKVHRFLGFIFVAGWIHAFLAGSVVASNTFMYWYLLTICATATAVFVHYSLLSDILHRYYRYTVIDKTILEGGVLRLKLKPKYRIMNFIPGQFVYVSLPKMSDTGYHPFSIASGKKSSILELYIKELGNFTTELESAKKGDEVRVKGPYGGFTFNDKRFSKQIWIAGGIGITPFLSKVRSLEHARKWPEIELIYATAKKYEAFAADELEALERQHGGFNYTLVHATKFGQKSLKEIAEHFRSDLKDCAIYLCGPPAMLAAYKAQAEEMGLSDQLYFEEFNY